MRTRSLRFLALGSVAFAALVAGACSSSSSDDTMGTDDGGTKQDASIVDDSGSTSDGSTSDSGKQDGSSSDAATSDAGEPPVRIGAYGAFTCAATGGRLKCWGSNSYSQLGLAPSDTAAHYAPQIVPNIDPGPFGLGYHHGCAEMAGTIYCWGSNSFDQLGTDGYADAGDAGTLCNGVPCNATPASVMGLTGVTRLALGDFTSCALLSGGTISCWGDSTYGVPGTADAGHTCSSSPCTPSPLPVPSLTGVAEIDVGGDTACARKGTDGSVWCWGANYDGTLGVDTTDAGPDASGWDYDPHPTPMQVPGLTGTKQVAVGIYHACAVLASGQVACWGINNDGQLGHDPSLDDTNCNNFNDACRTTPQTVPGLTNVREIALGYDHSCAVKTDDTVVCWGSNTSGQLGRAIGVDSGAPDFAPQPVTGLANVAHLALGDSHSCAVKRDGSVFCWGLNDNGQVGNAPDAGDAAPPTQVPSPTAVGGL